MGKAIAVKPITVQPSLYQLMHAIFAEKKVESVLHKNCPIWTIAPIFEGIKAESKNGKG